MSKNSDKIDKLKRFGEAFRSQELLTKLGVHFETSTRRRTIKGKDIEGHTFKPYSKQYAKKRRKLGEPTSPVNLRIDHRGGMLEKVDHAVARDLKSVEGFINDTDKERIGFYHAVSGAGKGRVIRKWWGMSEDDQDDGADILKEEANEQLIKILDLNP